MERSTKSIPALSSSAIATSDPSRMIVAAVTFDGSVVALLTSARPVEKSGPESSCRTRRENRNTLLSFGSLAKSTTTGGT